MTSPPPLETWAVVIEHGVVPRSGADLCLGACLGFIPNHACPVANLARSLLVRHGDAVEEWPVDTRGRTR